MGYPVERSRGTGGASVVVEVEGPCGTGAVMMGEGARSVGAIIGGGALVNWPAPAGPVIAVRRTAMLPALEARAIRTRSRSIMNPPRGMTLSLRRDGKLRKPRIGASCVSAGCSGESRLTTPKPNGAEVKNFDKNFAPMNSRAYKRHRLWSKLTPKNGSSAMPASAPTGRPSTASLNSFAPPDLL